MSFGSNEGFDPPPSPLTHRSLLTNSIQRRFGRKLSDVKNQAVRGLRFVVLNSIRCVVTQKGPSNRPLFIISNEESDYITSKLRMKFHQPQCSRHHQSGMGLLDRMSGYVAEARKEPRQFFRPTAGFAV